MDDKYICILIEDKKVIATPRTWGPGVEKCSKITQSDGPAVIVRNMIISTGLDSPVRVRDIYTTSTRGVSHAESIENRFRRNLCFSVSLSLSLWMETGGRALHCAYTTPDTLQRFTTHGLGSRKTSTAVRVVRAGAKAAGAGGGDRGWRQADGRARRGPRRCRAFVRALSRTRKRERLAHALANRAPP